SSRRRHTMWPRDWSSDVCSSDLKLLDALAASPHAPPAPADVGASLSLVRALVREGAIVELDGIVFATSALDDARERIGRLVVQRESISIADVRDLLRTSRKYILPIVNRMDAEGVTRRRGDLRIPGPRARPSGVAATISRDPAGVRGLERG